MIKKFPAKKRKSFYSERRRFVRCWVCRQEFFPDIDGKFATFKLLARYIRRFGWKVSGHKAFCPEHKSRKAWNCKECEDGRRTYLPELEREHCDKCGRRMTAI